MHAVCGIFPMDPAASSTLYTLQYIVCSQVEKLYTFRCERRMCLKN